MLVSPSSRRGMQFIHKTFLPRLTIAKSKQAQSHVLIAKVESKHAARSTMKCMDSRIENFEEISLFIAESTPSLLEERSATVSSDSGSSFIHTAQMRESAAASATSLVSALFSTNPHSPTVYFIKRSKSDGFAKN